MNVEFASNTLYYGDCLDVMSDFPDGCIDLIYLDPPFNSNQKYHAIFKASGLGIAPQLKAFDDAWKWDDVSAERVQRLKGAVANPASKVVAGLEMFIPQSEMLSYISYMAERLFVTRRLLNDKGSIYLHCDPTASHYLKLVMDAIFGEDNFRNEIVWHYRRWTAASKQFQRMHDLIFWYAKTNDYVFTKPLQDYADEDYIEDTVRGVVDGKLVRLKNEDGEYIKRAKQKGGVLMHDVWHDINFIAPTAAERLKYPTQKPLALLDRIIKASSNPDDLVLDPFAGCGTTVEAAVKNNRRVIGIDILPFALRLINAHRIPTPFPIQGVPVDFETASALAKADPFKFQDWAISLIDGLAANSQKVGDAGVDGYGAFLNEPDNMNRKAIIVQVTGASGSQKAKYDQLHAAVHNENAAMGILITLDPQTAQSRWRNTLEPIRMGQTTYRPIQCFSIKEYYQHDRQWEVLLTLPPLANPWTGKPVQRTLWNY